MPRVTVEVWSYLSQLFVAGRTTRHCLEVEIEDGATLAGLVRRLADENPGFAQVMYRPDTYEPSGRVAAVVNGRLAELLDNYETKLYDRDRVILVQAYAGG